MTHDSFCLIGGGAAGTALGRALRRAGLRPAAVVCRTIASARRASRAVGGGAPSVDPAGAAQGAAWVILAVPDGEIRLLCGRLERARAFRRGQKVLHLSGSLGRSVLAAAARRGARTAAFHPFASFPSREPAPEGRRSGGPSPEGLRGVLFGIDASRSFYPEAARLARRLGGIPARVPKTARTLYHAAGVFAANYAVVQAAMACRLLREAGVPAREAEAGVAAILKGVARNVDRVGTLRAITGPASRGDLGTLRAHAAALRRLPEEARKLYAAGARTAARLGVKKGTLSPARARAVLRLFP